MISSEELEKNYAKYTDSEIINLAKNSKGLRPEAVILLTKEIEKRKLNIEVNNPKIENPFIDSEINSFVLEKYPDTVKTYPFNKNEIRNISFLLFGFGVFFLRLFYNNFYISDIRHLDYHSLYIISLFISIILTYFGIKMLKRKDENVQLFITDKEIIFKRQRDFGKYRFQDFYNRYISEKNDGIFFQEIEDIIIPDNLFRVGTLFFQTYQGEKVYVLIKCNKLDLKLLAIDLKKIIESSKNDVSRK